MNQANKDSRLGMLSALRHGNFRAFWIGLVVSVSGMQMFYVIQVWLVYHLTESALQLGMLGLARAVPSIILGLAGGVAADKIDQRKLLMFTSIFIFISYTILATLTLTGSVKVWHILITVFVVGGFQAFDQASRQAIFPHLIPRSEMLKAVALNSTVHPGSRIYAPLIGGFFIDYVGTPIIGASIAIYVIALTYVFFCFQLSRVRMPAIPRSAEGNGFQEIVNGLKYISFRPIFRLLIATSFINAFFGMSHLILAPILVGSFFGNASGSAVAMLFSMEGLGGVVGAIVGGNLSASGHFKIHNIIVLGAAFYGVFLVGIAISPIYAIVAILELLSSTSNNLFSVIAQTTLQTQVTDEFRGRVMGIWSMTYSIMRPFGQLGMGAIGNTLNAPLAIGGGGLVVFVIALLGCGRSNELRSLKNS